MVSSYKVFNPSLGCCALAESPCFAKLAYSHASLALSQRCRPRSARAVRPASLAASARSAVCRQALAKVRTLCSQAWACHAGKIAGFGHAGLAVQARISEHFMRLPASQRLKPQSSMPEQFCVSPFASAAQYICRSLGSQGRRVSSRVSSFKEGCVCSQQPPNPSFKRTHASRLRRLSRSA